MYVCMKYIFIITNVFPNCRYKELLKEKHLEEGNILSYKVQSFFNHTHSLYVHP